jgi:predicted dehydrogenase
MPSPSAALRVGVVGVGSFGRNHARVYRDLQSDSSQNLHLVGVVDADYALAQAVAKEFHTSAFRSLGALLHAGVQAVSVAVPTAAHLDVARELMAKGIDLLVEKPLTATLGEADEMIGLAERYGCIVQIGHLERFNPAVRATLPLLTQPMFFEVHRLSVFTPRSLDVDVVLDLMIHDIDLVLSLTQSAVRSVAAVGVSLFGEHEDVANARVEFENGTVANLTASRASYAAMRKMRIWSAEGYASLDFAGKSATLVQPSDEFLSGWLDLEKVDLSQPMAVKQHVFGKVLRVDQVQPAGREPLALEIEDFVQAVRCGTRPRVGGDDALRAMRLADQILKSLNAHHWDGDASVNPLPAQSVESNSVLRGPHAWRIKNRRQKPSATGH